MHQKSTSKSTAVSTLLAFLSFEATPEHPRAAQASSAPADTCMPVPNRRDMDLVHAGDGLAPVMREKSFICHGRAG